MSNNNYQIYHENDYCIQIDQTIISMVYNYFNYAVVKLFPLTKQ